MKQFFRFTLKNTRDIKIHIDASETPCTLRIAAGQYCVFLQCSVPHAGNHVDRPLIPPPPLPCELLLKLWRSWRSRVSIGTASTVYIPVVACGLHCAREHKRLPVYPGAHRYARKTPLSKQKADIGIILLVLLSHTTSTCNKVFRYSLNFFKLKINSEGAMLKILSLVTSEILLFTKIDNFILP